MASDHPGNFRDAIIEFQYRDKTGIEGYMLYLFHSTRRMAAQSLAEFDGVYFHSDALRLKRELEMFFNWIDRSAAKQTKMQQLELKKLNDINLNLHQELITKKEELTKADDQINYWQGQACALQESIERMSGTHGIASAQKQDELFPSEYSQIALWAKKNLQES